MQNWYGALGYADDVSFISPSQHSLRMMCNIYLANAQEFDITFNPMKCQFLYNGNYANVTFIFDNGVLHAIKKGIHLDHVIGPNVNENVLQQMF